MQNIFINKKIYKNIQKKNIQKKIVKILTYNIDIAEMVNICFIQVKPISAADQKTLYSAIAMAQELTARSMTDLEHPPESPCTPASPSRRRKFSFKLPHQHSPKPDRRHFSEEAASIPDIQVHKMIFVLLKYIKRFISKIKTCQK